VRYHRSLRSNRWAVARVLLPAVIVFATTQLLATLLHITIFNWAHPVAWAWLAMYIVSPPAGALLFALNERGYDAESNGPLLGNILSTAMTVLVGAYALAGLALFLFPTLAAPLWPWSLTPLSARVIGGWLLTTAALAGMVARQPRLGTAWVVLLALVVLAALLLLGALWYRMKLNGPPLSIALYLIVQIVLGGLSGYGYWKFVREGVRNR
jgi:hypothetical protein